ncbi:Fur family transcriptional regulator [Iamia majanohamensis]|uniref:Fur family transcriptional regulator n=1 Tax=Iamia majanohamensis TaxID=467976 RepID=A0AAE9Y767_9ACTN|nr:Fur family transcriptional regulator [Iamia majanohamensis]WCO65653.1 Fur family transcriptional regulator [Iamia majanohamensis]
MRSPDELTDLFRSRGLRVTPQRQCIFGVLHDSSVHPTAEAVHADVVAHMPTVSLRTVYQTLNDLADMGELVPLDLGTGSTRFDPTVAPHHHMVCDRCGRVHDLHADVGEVAVPEAERDGFTIFATEIVFRGLCEHCSSAPGDGPGDTRAPAAHIPAAPAHTPTTGDITHG